MGKLKYILIILIVITVTDCSKSSDEKTVVVAKTVEITGVFDTNASSDRGEVKPVVYNEKIYYSKYLNSSTGEELYSYDGSTESLASDVGGTSQGKPRSLTLFNSSIYFSADTYSYGRELHKYDGNTVTRLTDLKDGTSDSSPESLVVSNSNLYFISLDDNSTNRALYKIDSSNTTTRITTVTYSTNTSSSSYPIQSDLKTLNSSLYFLSDNDNGSTNDCLMEYDGISFTCHDITAITGSTVSNRMYTANYFDSVGTYLMWSCYSATKGRELCVFDGTNISLYDLNLNQNNSNPRNFIEYNSKVYFSATDTYGEEMWLFDTSTPTRKLDIYSGSSSGYFYPVVVANSKLFFQGKTDSTNYYDLYEYDDTTGLSTVLEQSFSWYKSYCSVSDSLDEDTNSHHGGVTLGSKIYFIDSSSDLYMGGSYERHYCSLYSYTY